MTGNIVWLASYPKSGNTWFRIFLANAISKQESPVKINELKIIPIASSRSLLDNIAGMATSDLSVAEVDSLRPGIYTHISNLTETVQYYKIHDANRFLDTGEQLIPASATKATIYIIRNPLDVAISFAHYTNTSVDRVIDNMNNVTNSIGYGIDSISNQVRQTLLSWSMHVQSWTEKPQWPLKIIRYEDMLAKPEVVFRETLDFLKISITKKKFDQAIIASTFNELQIQEIMEGFSEKVSDSSLFFRQGKAGTGIQSLTLSQKNRIIDHHANIMKQYKYIDAEGKLVN